MICRQPFAGLGGKVLRLLTGYRPSRKSPNICNRCDEVMPLGGAEVDTAILFADIRGSTGLAEQMGAGPYAALISRFYTASTRVITVEQQGWIDKFVGDELMALYIPAMGPGYRGRAVRSAVTLLQAVGYAPGKTPWIPLAVGLHAGPAFIGKPGADASAPVTALGDTVNAAARMSACSAPPSYSALSAGCKAPRYLLHWWCRVPRVRERGNQLLGCIAPLRVGDFRRRTRQLTP
jgi:adenylate cyclase